LDARSGAYKEIFMDAITETKETRKRRALGKEWDACEIRDGYLISSGWLVGFGTVKRSYNPLAYPELVSEFAKLREGDEQVAITFASTWGLPSAPSQTSQGNAGGVPLSQIWRHASNVRLVLELLDLLRRKDGPSLDGLLKSRNTSSPETGDRVIRYIAGVEERAAKLTAGDPIIRADSLIKDIINANAPALGGVATVLKGRVPKSLLISYHVLPAVYHMLAGAVEKRAVWRCEAPDCGQVFLRTDERQRHCPPSSPWSPTWDSSCAMRARKSRERSDDAKADVGG
jgi:hypothetical protein